MDKSNAEQAIAAAKKYFYLVQIVPEATEEEKNYYIEFFKKNPTQGNYKEFYSRALCERIEIFNTSFNVEYNDPLTLYNLHQLETLTGFRKAIEKAQEQCDFDEVDNIYLKEEEFINSINGG